VGILRGRQVALYSRASKEHLSFCHTKYVFSLSFDSLSCCCFGINLVDTDEVVAPSRVEVRARLVEAEGLASKVLLGSILVLFLGGSSDVSLDPGLVWQVKNLDSFLGGNDEPVKLW